MPLVFAPHLVFDGSVGHHTSWIPRIKSYESHDHDEWVNPIPNPELIQKHPTEVFGLTFTILKKVLDILRSYVVLLCRMCPLCCSTWTMEWCLAHFWDLEKAAMAHSWKVKKCDSAGTGTKKSNKKRIKISSSWAPHKNSGHMWSALQCSCNASKLPLSNSNREIHAEQGRTNTP